jgi:protein-tyrosine kinase
MQYSHTAVVDLDPAHLERNRVIAHQKTHLASWAFDVLRTQVLQKMDENGWRTIAVTSPSLESGKTLVSINLALSIAQQAQRTALLVDFDLRRPSVAGVLGLAQPVSLNEVLTGDVDVSQAMVSPGIERLVVLPTNRAMPRAAELLSSPGVSTLIGELRQRYDDRIVVFDLPPVLVADDVMAVLPHVDCVLMVVGSGVSDKAEIEEAMNRVARANLLGIVLNKDTAPAQQDYY